MTTPRTPIRVTSSGHSLEGNFFGGVPGAPKGKSHSLNQKKIQSERKARIDNVAKRLSFSQGYSTSANVKSTTDNANNRPDTITRDNDCVFLDSPFESLERNKARPIGKHPPLKRYHSSSTSLDDLIYKKMYTTSADPGIGSHALPSSTLLQPRISMKRSISAFTVAKKVHLDLLANQEAWISTLHDVVQTQSLSLVDLI